MKEDVRRCPACGGELGNDEDECDCLQYDDWELIAEEEVLREKP